MVPVVVIRPIWLLPDSVNQRLPSGPGEITKGSLLGEGIVKSVTAPVGVMRPILLST